MTQMIPGARVDEDRPLAWSEDAEEDDPVPYTGPEHSGEYAREAMSFDYAEGEGYGAVRVEPQYRVNGANAGGYTQVFTIKVR